MAYTSGIRRERSRRRRRFIWRASIALLIAAGFAALGVSAYRTGTLLAESRVTELAATSGDLAARLEGARLEAAGLQASLADARKAMQNLQARYDSDVPKGEPAELLGIARDRLGQGMPASRLAQVLREATPTRGCESRGTRKRFAIQQGGRVPDDTAVLLDGLVQVSVAAATTEPARPAMVTITQAWSAEPLKVTGLPARQDIVVNNLVLHLLVEPSDVAGFAAATLSTCVKG